MLSHHTRELPPERQRVTCPSSTGSSRDKALRIKTHGEGGPVLLPPYHGPLDKPLTRLYLGLLPTNGPLICCPLPHQRCRH